MASTLTHSSPRSSRAWLGISLEARLGIWERQGRVGCSWAKGRVVVAAFLGTRSICESCWTCECRHVMHVGVRSLIYLWVRGNGDVKGAMYTWMGSIRLACNQGQAITRCVRYYYNGKGQGQGLMSSGWDMCQSSVDMTWVTALTWSGVYQQMSQRCYEM